MLELPTHKRILIEAQDLVQRHGFFGLSLQDLADRLSIRKPSLYAHYASKESLGVAILKEYQRQFTVWTEEVRALDPLERLNAFLALFEGYLEVGKVCPHSALSLEGPNLPSSIREAYLEYYRAQVEWLSALMSEGKSLGRFSYAQESNALAAQVLQRLVGVQLGVRMTGSGDLFRDACAELTLSLGAFH